MELSRKSSKRNYFKCTIVYFLTCCMFFNTSLSVALAGPEGAQVVNGRVSFQQSGYNTTITASDKSIINYSSFDIARPEIVQFIQPGSSASVLNRILSANPTNINGTLLANGRVFFVNPAGVYIGAGARVNVNQWVASGLNITNSDFINGRYNFAGGNGAVTNSGDISAEKVYLIGRQVANFGSISCPAGYVVMASGDRVFLGEPGTDVVLEVDVPSLPEPAVPLEGSGVLNEGTVDAAGGTIVLAAGDIYSQAISNTGSLSASVETGDAGQVTLTADGGQVTNTGTIEASGSKGGQVVMEGARVGQFGTVHADGTEADGGSVDLWAGEVVALSSDSLTTANAGLNGDGGDVISFSPSTALFRDGAKIEAIGGQLSGDGGFVEISGLDYVEVQGSVKTLAPNGMVGTYLIDPGDVEIRAAANSEITFTTGAPDQFQPDNGNVATSVLNIGDTATAGTLLGELVSNNVEVLTANAPPGTDGFGDGDITVVDSINYDGIGTRTLTLTADDDIFINGSISDGTPGGDTLNLVLTATANVDINAAITTNGGTFISSGVDFDNTGGTIDAGGGSVDLNHTGLVTISADVTTTGAGTIDVTGVGVTVNTDVDVTTANGQLTVDAGTGALTVSDSAGPDARSTLTTTNAAISITADDVVIQTNDTTNTDQIVAGGGNDITIANTTAAQTIGLGGGAGTLSLSDAEIGELSTTGTVVIGSATAGTITANTADFSVVGAGADLTLITGADIQDTGVAVADELVADVLTLTAVTDIGTSAADPLNINASSLDASAEAAGNIMITETDGLTLADVDTVSSDITITSTTGNIALADLDEVVSAGSGGSVILRALAGSITVAVDDKTKMEIKTSGSVTLTGAAIGGTNPLDIEDATSLTINDLDGGTKNIQIREQSASKIASTTITVPTDKSGNIDITYFNTDSVDIDNGHVLSADLDQGVSSFSYTADTGDITVGAVNTGTNAVSITATTGSINETGTGDAAVDITAGALTLTAQDEIGGASEMDIETTVTSLDASSTSDGDIVITETDGIILTDVDTVDGAVTISAGDKITATDVVAGDADDDERHDVKLTTTSGGMVLTSVVADDDIVCTADVGDLEVQNSLGAADRGGVSLIAKDGKVYTTGDVLNVAITGYSDDAASTGVELPFGSSQKAAIVIISNEDLNLGTGAVLTANGKYYPPPTDERPNVNFQLDGEEIDAAIYLASADLSTGMGKNVDVGSAAITIDNSSGVGTLVVDAFDTITFKNTFEDSLRLGGMSDIKRLEAVSRISPDLNYARLNHTLPYADNPTMLAGGEFALSGGVYVLRGTSAGSLFSLAKVLDVTGPVPIVVPMPLEPEIQGEVEDPDMEAIMQLLDELGIGTQPFLALAYEPSLNTDLRLYKAAEKLLRLKPILEDADGTRIAALVPIIRGISETPVPTEEEMTSFVQELTRQELAGQWINALTKYVAIQNAEIGRPLDTSVATVMRIYVRPKLPNEELFINIYVARLFGLMP